MSKIIWLLKRGVQLLASMLPFLKRLTSKIPITEVDFVDVTAHDDSNSVVINVKVTVSLSDDVSMADVQQLIHTSKPSDLLDVRSNIILNNFKNLNHNGK